MDNGRVKEDIDEDNLTIKDSDIQIEEMSDSEDQTRGKSLKDYSGGNENRVGFLNDEIELIYKQQQSTQGNVCLSTLIILFFFIYQISETYHFFDVIGMSAIVKSVIESSSRISYEEIVTTNNLTNWIDDLLPAMFTNTPFRQTVSPYLWENTTDGTHHSKPSEILSYLNVTSQAQYAVFIDKNYFAGMRISTVYAELESTKNSIHEQVIPHRRSYRDNNENHLHIPDEMDPISPNFMYRDTDFIANDAKKRGGGVYGKGFVQFFTADQSLAQARYKLNQMIDANWFNDEKILSTSVELMFYNDVITQGIINTYQFYSTNNGDIIQTKTTRMYLPENYNFKHDRQKSMSMSKLATLILLLICISIDMFTHTLLLSKKIRSMMMHRINEFQFRDFIVLLQIAIFTVLFIYGGSLFGEQMAGKSNFKLPIRTEKTFQHWVRWSQQFMTFRTLLGASAIFQVLNFLLVASNNVPSLGILFETLSRAKKNLCYFTMLVLLVFVCSVVSCYILFGSNKKDFSTFSQSMLTNFQMVFGDVPYTDLYEANKQASATFFVIFVCVFCFFIMNIYSAIIIGTYQKVRVQKLMLSAAMMRIIGNNTKTKFFNWLNLITFQQSKQGNRQQRDSREEGQIQLTRRQIFWKNWAIIMQKQIETKEQFVANLKNTAEQIQREKEEQFKQQQERLQGNHPDSINSESSFKILKRSIVFIFYITISLVFFLNSTNNNEKMLVFKPISTYLQSPYYPYGTAVRTRKHNLEDVKNFDQLTSYLNVTVGNFDAYRGFGFSYPVGDTFARLNFRFYNQQLNNNLDTAAIFPAHISPQPLKTDIGTLRTTYDEKLYSYLGSQYNFNPEYTEDLKHEDGTHKYIKSGDPLLTVLGSGGYSFTFGQNRLEKNYNKTVSEMVVDFAQEQKMNPLAMINLEMLVYTPNYRMFTYIVLEFLFKPSGELDSSIFSYQDNPKNRLRWQQITLFSVWFVFSLYYMILLMRKIVSQWQAITAEQNKDKVEVHRSRCNKFLIWFGIDSIRLKNTNPVAMIVLAIIMIIKHFFTTFFKLIRSVLRHCGSNVFNYFDLFITYMTIQVIVQYITLIYQDYRIPDFGQLEQTSKMATFYMNYLYNTGITMMFMFLKSLEIFQFSTSSNLIVSAISSGYADILNYIVIYMILLFGEATAAYIVFGSQMTEFRSVQASIYSILKMLNGNFLFREMQQTNPNFATMFFIYVLIVHWILLLNIFIGLIKGNFIEEQKKIQSRRDQDGLLKVIWRILSNHWIKTYREERLKMKKANEIDNNEARKNEKDVVEEELPTMTWAFGCAIPQWVVLCLNSWLDPDNERIQKSPSNEGKKEEKIKDEGDVDDQEIQQESLELIEQTEGDEKNDEVMNTPYKLDADYIVDKGIKPYLQHFDELFDLVQKSQKYSPEEEVKVKKEIQKITNNPQVMKLKDQWNLTTLQDKPVTDANFWLHHLDENILNLTKRQTSLQDFRCFDQFFSELLIQRKTDLTKFQTFVIEQMHDRKSYKNLLLKMAAVPDAFLLEDFKNRFSGKKKVISRMTKVDKKPHIFETVMNYKYFAWKAIDRRKRQKVFEHLLQSQKKADDEKVEVNSVLEIVGILENEQNLSISDKNIVLPVLDVLKEKEFTFDQQCASYWRRTELNMVPQDLRVVWRNLSLEEKYELWYNRFDARERVRLWNSLVFQLNWFERVVDISKTENKTHPPFRADIKLEIDRIKKQRIESQTKYANKHKLRSLSLIEEELAKYLSYGPTQLRVLWNILFKMWPTDSQIKQVGSGRKNAVGEHDKALPKDQRRNNFEGGSEEDSAGLDDPKSRQASSTGAGSGGNRVDSDDQQKPDPSWREEKNTKAQDALKRFEQVQYFFKNMNNFMKTELKEIKEEEKNNEPAFFQQTEFDPVNPNFPLNSKQKEDSFQRQFKHFQTIVKKLQPDDFNNNLHPEEERLQLWILLTKREKFDMLFHQVVEYEAQMMSFLLEAEHGEMGIDTSINQINDLDNEMESALNQQIFRKYIAFTRLQATLKSKAYFQQREKTALDQDAEIIRFCSFLKERYTKSDLEIKWLKAAYEEKEEQLKKLLAHIKAIATGKLSEEDKKHYTIDAQIQKQCELFWRLHENA